MIYFISGHRNLSYDDFEKYYIPKINEVMDGDCDAEFIVGGDCEGVDKFAMDYIYSRTFHPLIIFHMSDTPKFTPKGMSESSIPSRLKFKGGFKSDEERDTAMTRDSNFDIAFIKDNRWNSGTAQNIKRRHSIN